MAFEIIYYYTITFDHGPTEKITVIKNHILVTVNKMFIYIYVLLHGKAD